MSSLGLLGGYYIIGIQFILTVLKEWEKVAKMRIGTDENAVEKKESALPNV